MRWRRPPRRRRATRASTASSSARRTRISRSACAARASCRWTAARATIRDEAGVIAKFGVPPASIPDYLASWLTRPTAIRTPGWGAKSAAAVLARYHHLEAIPDDWRTWGVNASSPARLARALADARTTPSCFGRWRRCARTCDRVRRSVDELAWRGPDAAFAALAARLDAAPKRSLKLSESFRIRSPACSGALPNPCSNPCSSA